MNSIMEEQGPILKQTQALRNQLMEILTDEDLSYSPGGANPTLGALCREMGEVQHAYIESFKTFQQDFSYRHEEPGLEDSVERLTVWFQALDGDLKAALESLFDLHSALFRKGLIYGRIAAPAMMARCCDDRELGRYRV